MALSQTRGWLIAYDIANNRRLGRVHRLVVKHCLPVQYSLYYYEGSPRALRDFLSDIEALINTSADDVRAYPLPNPADVVTLGRGSLPEPIRLLSAVQPQLVDVLKPRKG